MTPPNKVPAKSSYKHAAVLFALCSIAFFTACQLIVGNSPKNISSSPTSSISLTPTIWATFTHLPGDIYFLYQTQTAAPTQFPTVRLESTNPLKTLTPQYGLTETVIAVTESTCLLAYPDFCVSPNVRLGCGALLDKGLHDFTVKAPDPYGYDRDDDGIGCEIEK